MRLDAWKYLTNTWDRAEKERSRQDNASAMFFETVSRNDWMAVGRLLENGCSVNMLLGHRSALMVAAQYGALESLKLLLGMGAAIGAQDEVGQDALFYALDARQDAIVAHLLEHGPRMKRMFADNATPLIFAAKAGYVSGVAALVKYDRNMVNYFDRLGRTALWHVLSKEEMTDEDNQIARILMDNGASAEMTDFEGVSARDAASSQNSKSLLERADIAATLDDMPVAPEPAAPRRSHRL